MRRYKATLINGHGIASGQNPKSPYPAGSLSMQQPYFLEYGIDIRPYFSGTLNLDISPNCYRIIQPWKTIDKLIWFDSIPAEDFSFFHIKLYFEEHTYDGLIYRPHPETKSAHFHADNTIEVLAPYISISVGNQLEFSLEHTELEIISSA